MNEELGGAPPSPQAAPPPHLIPTCSGSQLSLANCMVAPLPCHAIILPLRNLSWVVPDQSLSRAVRVAVKPSDEPLRKGETVKARRVLNYLHCLYLFASRIFHIFGHSSIRLLSLLLFTEECIYLPFHLFLILD